MLERLLKTASDRADAMSLSSELAELHEDLSKLAKRVKMKSLELIVLETLAMDSDNDNIVELRNQLFVATRLAHSDIITEVADNLSNESDFDCINESGYATPGRIRPTFSIDRIMEKVRDLFKRKVILRRYMKKIGTQTK